MLRVDRVRLCLWIVCLATTLIGTSATAQQSVMVQDSTLNNLVHPDGYTTCTPGTLGGVLEMGTGNQNIILITGFGFGAEAWKPFMERNKTDYHFFAVTLPGFDGTPAPPMPPDTTSYGAQSWTNASATAVAKLITDRKLQKPVLIGHFVNGTQVALRVALDHPELVGGVVLIAGSAKFEPVKESPYWPKGLPLEKKVQMVDKGLAPRWFKTVTRETWNTNNFQPIDYALDPELGQQLFEMSNATPLPIMVRYLCEFHASDVSMEIKNITLPTLLIKPGFTEEFAADTTHSYMAGYLQECWLGIAESNPKIQEVTVDSAMTFTMYDQPEAVDQLIARFVKDKL